jgi:SpoVK/Ycf46/Vps4 family AAA+-type ATPase
VQIFLYVLSGHANDRNTKKNSGSGPGTVSEIGSGPGTVSGIGSGPGTVSGIGSTSSGSSTSVLCKQRQSVEDGSGRVSAGLYGDRSNICVDIEAERVESHQSVLYRNRDKNRDREEGGERHDGDDIESENGDENEDGDEDENEEGDKDGDGGGRGVVVIAATNRLEDLDPAVVRRFESKVYVGVPEHDTRVAMIVTFLRYPGEILLMCYDLM